MALKTKHIAIIGVIALAAGALAAFLLPKKKGGGFTSGTPSGSKTGTKTETVTEIIPGPPLSPTALTSGQAITIANNLLVAMDRYGTDEQSIIDNFNRVKSKADLLLVIEKFGTHKYFAVGTIFGLGKEKNLMEWLKADLNKDELTAVKQNVFDKFNVSL